MKKCLIIVFLMILVFQFAVTAEDNKLRVTINVDAYGRSVAVALNGVELKRISGGLSESVQLYHKKHPLLEGAPEGFKGNFCLEQGKNIIKIVHLVKDGGNPMPLEISIQAIGYDIPLLKYSQKASIKKGETSGMFELLSQQPPGFKTVILE